MTAKPDTPKTFSIISNKKLRHLYSMMLKCRILDSHARLILRSMPSIKGQEAVIAGSGVDLQTEDAVFTAHHVIGSCLRETPLPRKPQRMYDRSRSWQGTKPALDLAAQIGLATGAALAHNSKNSGSMVLAILSNATGTIDSARDALIFASLRKLPVIYLRNVEIEEDEPSAYGLPIIPVDGSDVVAVYRVVYECTLRARQGGGPSMIDCKFSKTKRQDPVRNMEQYLRTKGIFTETWKQQKIRSIDQKVEKRLSKAKKTAQKKPVISAEINPFLYL